MAVKNKAEIKLYFELNDQTPKEVAKHFKMSYRTLAHWIKNEGWERGKFSKDIQSNLSADELLNKENFSLISASESKVKRELLTNIGGEANGVNGLILDNMLDKRTDELLMNALGISFINKNIALMALIAKDETMRILKLRKETEPSPLLVGSAEKTAKIFSDLKDSAFGKDAKISVNVNQNDDLENLSDAELRAIIAAAENDE